MTRKKLFMVLLSAALIVQGTGMMAIAKVTTDEGKTSQNMQIASDSNAEYDSDDPEDADEIEDNNNPEDADEIIDNNDPEDANENKDINDREDVDGIENIDNLEEFVSLYKGVRVASPSEAETVVSSERELTEAVAQGVNTIYIDGNISLTNRLFIQKNTDIHLMGGSLSCGLERPGDSSPNQMIAVAEGAKLTLSDIEINATGWGNANAASSRVRAYTIYSMPDSEIVIEDGTNLLCEPEDMGGKVVKRGLFLGGYCEMNGGTVRGFSDGGVTVAEGAHFILKGGEITENGNYTKENDFPTAGAGIQGLGSIELNGGIVNSNEYGIWVNGNLVINEGEVSQNIWGVYNNNADGKNDEQYAPVTTINGGVITDNETAITNLTRGTVVINDGAEISGPIIQQNYRIFSRSALMETSCVIRNSEYAKLSINGGSITAQNENTIAVYNMETGKLEMDGGTIIAAGTAIKNENPTIGEVKLTKGTISLTGENGKAIDNQGYMEASGDIEIEASNQYLIAVSHNDGGKVSPSTLMASKGSMLNFTISPDNGYKISSVKLDGEEKGIISALELTVAGNHAIEVEFAIKQSGGSGGSGGSSGSGRSSRAAAAKTDVIPETPGTWSQDQNGWRFVKSDGSSYSNTWVRKSNNWYWIDVNGYMAQGWIAVSDKWYYLMPVSGEMKTGWIFDNNNWYYSNASGERMTGWIQDKEKWYYLNTDGKMAVSATTPDGFRVDENGVWIQ